MRYIGMLLCVGVWLCSQAFGQSVSALQEAYSGISEWDSCSQTLSFVTAGTIHFSGRTDFMDYKWEVPNEVKTLFIGAEVEVNGFFHFGHSATIIGADSQTSVIYGTSTVNLLRTHGLDHKGLGSQIYSTVYGRGEMVLHVQNLTVLNPFGFMFTGKDGAVIHLKSVRGIDNRGGHHNHSDGISAYHGSTVRNCYFEAGDDVIKVYHDIYVENTTINMITNSVPIQLGWGNYGDKAIGVFRNVRIIGTSGRGNVGNAIINARKGAYDKTLVFQGLIIENPHATLFDFWNEQKGKMRPGGNIWINIRDGDIQVEQFKKHWNMEVDLQFCGKTNLPALQAFAHDCE